MKTYSVGIMSSKWNIEAPSLDVAVVVVRISQKTSAPIVCYNADDEQSAFGLFDGYTLEQFQSFCDEHIDDIRIAYRTMELVA